MQTLYLIRHTKPDIAPGTCYGQLDVDLDDSFEQEAQRIQRWLPPVELILASPLQRAHRLGAYLAQAQGCELRSDTRLMEKHFGTWEGQMWDDIPRPELDAWATDIMDYAPPDGESARQLMQRLQDFLHDLAQLPQQDIALTTHCGSIRAMLALLGKTELPDILGWEVEYGTVIGLRVSR